MNKQEYIKGKIKGWENKYSNLKNENVNTKECDLYRNVDYTYDSRNIILPYTNYPMGKFKEWESWKPIVKIVRCAIRKSNESNHIKIGYRTIVSDTFIRFYESMFYDKIHFDFIDNEHGFEFLYNIFTKEVIFTDVKVGKLFSIQNCIFKSNVKFERCTFDCNVDFLYSIFDGSVKFENCEFRHGLYLPTPSSFKENYQDLFQEDVNSLFEIKSLSFIECSFTSTISCKGRKMEKLLIQDCEAKNGEIDVRQVYILGDFKIENIQQPNREFNVPILCFELKVEQNIIFKNIIFGKYLQLKAASFNCMRIENSTFQSVLDIAGENNRYRNLKDFQIINSTFNDHVVMKNVSFIEEPEFQNSHFNGGIDLSIENRNDQIENEE